MPLHASASPAERSPLAFAWFAAFPVWSGAFYAWFLWRVVPVGYVSPLMPPSSPHYISGTAFACFFVALFLIQATFGLLLYLLFRRGLRNWRQIRWVLIALAIPPIGVPYAYFKAHQ